MWYKSTWAKAELWKGFGIDPMRPTENAAFRNIYNQSLYAEYLRWLYSK